jgi:hypothetical protein
VSRRRALSEQQAIDAEAWFADFERVGTFEQKARGLGVCEDTLRDAINRVRGKDTKTIRRKLSEAEPTEEVA